MSDHDDRKKFQVDVVKFFRNGRFLGCILGAVRYEFR